MKSKETCCFIGHREIHKIGNLKKQLKKIIENLILSENINTFLFGSKSAFDDLCLETVTEIKEDYGGINRVYVRSEYRYIDDDYMAYLLNYYDETYYAKSAENGGRAVYVERNRDMIDCADVCVFYYDKEYEPRGRRSGTQLAYEYARQKKKRIINIAELS